MTAEEYRKAYRDAHRRAGQITLQTKRILQRAFKEAGDLAAETVAATEDAGLSDLTSAAWRQISAQLEAGAQIIGEAAEGEIPASLSKAYKGYLDADVEYIADAAKQAGSLLITDTGIRNIGVGIDFRLLQAQATRLYSDGYNFSERIWNNLGPDGLPTGVYGDYQYRIKNLILTGQAQGRDVIKIADDIQVYIARGKDHVFKEGRYGKLIPGTGEFKKRISRRVDWRALRLVRSELNASLQQAGVLEGIMNPASRDLYDWVKTPGNPIDPDGSRNVSGMRCIDLMEFNPYTSDTVPEYQHANCSCSVVPVLMNQKDFVDDLKNWEPNSGNVSYLDDWYNSVYLPSNQ